MPAHSSYERWAAMLLRRVHRLHLNRAPALVIVATQAPLVFPHAAHAQETIRLSPIASSTAVQLGQLGGVDDAAEDRHGRIFILDKGRSRIAVLSSRLELLGISIGRPQSGQWLYREPISLGLFADGRLAVLDRAQRLVRVLSVRDGGRMLVSDVTVALDIASESMCVLPDDRILIYGYNAGMRMHVFSPRGRLLRSYAPADSSLSPRARELVAQGRISCDLSHDEVIVTSRFLPTVEAFRISTGAPVWVDTLQPFRSLTLTDRPTGLSISSRPEGFSLISSVFSISSCRVFQTVYSSRTDNARADTVVSYVRAGAQGSIRAQLVS